MTVFLLADRDPACAALAPPPRTASSITRIDLQPELRNSRTPITEESTGRDPFHHVRLILLAEQERGNAFTLHSGAEGIARASGRRPLNRVLIEAEFALPASAMWIEFRTGRWLLIVGDAQIQGARAPRRAWRSAYQRSVPRGSTSRTWGSSVGKQDRKSSVIWGSEP
ncbi:hypothetical protein [Microbacterium sp.]|uniref:hypothetical protein n=1 Tax=Microbacterium sp. TaxID=51671 RepID=UPI0035AFD4CB